MLTAADSLGLMFVDLPTTAALAAVALIGYMFGQRTRRPGLHSLDEPRRRELARAANIAWQLESIADSLRRKLSAHHARVESFKRRLHTAQQTGDEIAWQQLRHDAELILGPTTQLAQQLTRAYDQFRRQSDALESFAQCGTRSQILGNGSALCEQLQAMLSSARGQSGLAVAIISLDRQAATNDSGPIDVPPLLPLLAGVLRGCMRDADFAARYGDEELVVVMPHTSLAGAAVLCERLRRRVTVEIGATVSGGIAVAVPRDDPRSLLARADSALYSAKAAGANRLFIHNGAVIREHVPVPAAAQAPLPAPPAFGRRERNRSSSPLAVGGGIGSRDSVRESASGEIGDDLATPAGSMADFYAG
jgi:diguanylate cyclase (GGDEF)-like protein